jgi:hypothetical protein
MSSQWDSWFIDLYRTRAFSEIILRNPDNMYGDEVVDAESRVAIESLCGEIMSSDSVNGHELLDSLLGAQIIIGSYHLTLISKFAQGRTNAVYRPRRSSADDIVLKCFPARSSMRMEYNLLVNLKHESWVPRAIIPPTLSSDGLLRC